jgi:hypothetical protein
MIQQTIGKQLAVTYQLASSYIASCVLLGHAQLFYVCFCCAAGPAGGGVVCYCHHCCWNG